MTTAEASQDDDFKPVASIAEQRIARVYAEAVLNAAEARHAVDEVKEELRELVEAVFESEPDFEAFLGSGATSKDTKQQVLSAVFENKSSELFFNLLMVLNEHDRLALLRPVHIVYNQLLDQRRRRIPVQVTTAVPMTDDQAGRLVSFLRDNLQLEPILEARIDADILGGMTVRVGDWMFDGSVRNDLTNIRKQLLARSSHEIQSRRDQISN
jgi:F-type H+-transporting ATPase subunit delta